MPSSDEARERVQARLDVIDGKRPRSDQVEPPEPNVAWFDYEDVRAILRERDEARILAEARKNDCDVAVRDYRECCETRHALRTRIETLEALLGDYDAALEFYASEIQYGDDLPPNVKVARAALDKGRQSK